MESLTLSQRVQVFALLYVLFCCLYPKACWTMTRGILGLLIGATRGESKTDATFLHPASKVLHRSGRATRWAKLPGYKRSLYSIEIVTAICGILYLRANYPAILILLLLLAMAGGSIVVGFYARTEWRQRTLTREVLRPMHKVLAPLVEQHAYVMPSQWIDIPKDYATNPSARVIIRLPEEFAGTVEQRRVIPPIVVSRLGGEWDHEFSMRGKTAKLIMRPAPNPPNTVRVADVQEAMVNAPEYAPVLGIGSHGRIISADFNSDSPHVCFSMGSGGGKSTATRALVMQLVRNGGDIEIIDIAKRGVSHLWAKGIPGVSIWRTAETAHDALVRLGKEMEGRYEEIYTDPSAESRFRRRVVLFEELNASMSMLKDYWRAARTKEDAKESPAIQAFANLLYAGRQGRINILLVAQSLTARAIGGPEARENFAFRVLGRYTMNAWKMLAPEVWPAPRSSKHVGRVQVVTGGEAHACQVLYTTDAEARAWSLGGQQEREPVRAVLTVEEPAETLAGAPERTYTLAEAARAKLIPVSYEAAKKIRQRHRDFPTGPRYTEKQLHEWFRNYNRQEIQ